MCESLAEGGRRCPLVLKRRAKSLERKLNELNQEFKRIEQGGLMREFMGLIDTENALKVVEGQISALSKMIQERLYENPDYSGKLADLEDRARLIANQESIKQILEKSAATTDRIEEHLEPLLLQKKELEFDISETHRNLELSRSAMAQLRLDSENPDLSAQERETAKGKLIQVETAKERMRETRALAFRKQASLRHELERQGVPANEIERLVSHVVADKGTAHLKTYKYYRGVVKNIQVKRRELREGSERNISKILNLGLPTEKQEALIATEEARFESVDAPLLKKFQETRFSMDSTSTGQSFWSERMKDSLNELKAQRSEALSNRNYAALLQLSKKHRESWANFKARQKRVEDFRKVGLSDRRNRDFLKNEIKQVVIANGGDKAAVETALSAYMRPKAAPLKDVDPALNIVEIQSSFTESDENELRADFHSSREFAEKGESGLHAYLKQKVLANPLTKLGGHSIDEITSSTEIFDTGKSSRHKTSKTGIRTGRVRVWISDHEREILKTRAESLHMTVSSYSRAMLLEDGNPWEGQNDRSESHRRVKVAKCRKLLET